MNCRICVKVTNVTVFLLLCILCSSSYCSSIISWNHHSVLAFHMIHHHHHHTSSYNVFHQSHSDTSKRRTSSSSSIVPIHHMLPIQPQPRRMLMRLFDSTTTTPPTTTSSSSTTITFDNENDDDDSMISSTATSGTSQELDSEYFMALQNFQKQQQPSSINDDDNENNQNTNMESSIQTTKSYLDDGFIYGLSNSGLQRPTGKNVLLVVEGDTTQTQLYQVVLVIATFCTHFYYIVNSIHQIFLQNGYENYNILLSSIEIILLFIGTYIVADFGSGVFHWGVDNYGNGRTPIFGNIIAAFQGHHTAPWTITQRSIYNNIYKLCIPFGILPAVILSYVCHTTYNLQNTWGYIEQIQYPFIVYCGTLFCTFEILSQEFHKWSHQTKNEVPQFVNVLQEYHICINRVTHAQHHMIPFDGNYCIISGICNHLLDTTGFFRRCERIIYQMNGIEPNSWKLDPILRKNTLQGQYSMMNHQTNTTKKKKR